MRYALSAMLAGLAFCVVSSAVPAQPPVPAIPRPVTETPYEQTGRPPAPPDRPAQARAPRTPTIAESQEAVRPLEVGDRVPPVLVRNMDGAPANLRAMVAGSAGSLIIFYRGGWCPYCNTHLAELAGMKDEFAERGVRVLALSPDSVEKLREGEDEGDTGYLLLSDSQFAAASAFGVAYAVDDETAETLRGYGLELSEWSGNSEVRALPVASAFLVDRTGTIRFVQLSHDYRERVSADALRAAMDAMLGPAREAEDAQEPATEPTGPGARIRVRQ